MKISRLCALNWYLFYIGKVKVWNVLNSIIIFNNWIYHVKVHVIINYDVFVVKT